MASDPVNESGPGSRASVGTELRNAPNLAAVADIAGDGCLSESCARRSVKIIKTASSIY